MQSNGSTNILNVVMLYLGDRKTQDDLIEMLRIIFKEKAPARVKKQQLEEAYGIRLTEDETKELSKMCNLSEGLYNSGFNDGTYGRAKTDLRNLIESTDGLWQRQWRCCASRLRKKRISKKSYRKNIERNYQR